MVELILASGSNRRHSLLSQLNIGYIVCVPSIDEYALSGETATDYVERMARSKALACCKMLSAYQAILAADTIISLRGEIIGKPKDIQHVKNILQKLSGMEHEVLTALYLKTRHADYKKTVQTNVKFRLLNDYEIDSYCLSDEPYDKAGAYAIQGLAASFVEYFSGSYTNAIGLPLIEVCELLKQANLNNFDNV